MKEVALTNYTAGLNTVLVYLTEIMSQVAQLRLHALVEQKIKMMRESTLCFERKPSNWQCIQCISCIQTGQTAPGLCQRLTHLQQTPSLQTGHRKSAYPNIEQVGESVHVFYPVRILFPQLIKDG